MPKRVARTLGLFLLVVAAFVAALMRAEPPARDWAFQLRPVSTRPNVETFVAESRYVSSLAVPSVHSATAVEISNGRVLAVWYGGSREGAKDVALYSAVFDPSAGDWGRESRVTTREETARDLDRYVKKLGNPVVASDSRRRLWLFYVSVSVGGWSGSSLNLRVSDDEGETWSPARRLVTSPFLNLSTLVRGPAVSFDDGTLGLPVYHELLGKFGELLKLSPDGEVLFKSRLSHGYSSLQPVVVPRSPKDGMAFLRRSGSSPSRVLTTETSDGGLSWSQLEASALPNPDSAVSAARLADGRVLLAFNDGEADRSRLAIAESADSGRSFRRLFELEPPDEIGDSEPRDFAYPWLLETGNGDLHLLYTWNRRRIVHVRFRAESAP
jgi:predicted neuraminidase